ncbi:hypothetical protein TIFTF001_017811 [Ficus carica]|uniref:Uncharacterized protein n=1 Tax=Ficus carica TaxID=3494 RepID=A0AA88DA59_FICCA|nr:hypothetical protein TIFTF001_017811 [Ficus carica]
MMRISYGLKFLKGNMGGWNNASWDPWIPWINGFIPSPAIPNQLGEIVSVVDLVVPGVPLRDAIKIKSVFSPESAEAILKLPCPLGGIDKAAVFLLLVRIWYSRLHERHKLLIWRIASDVLPTRSKCKDSTVVSLWSALFVRTWRRMPCIILLSALRLGLPGLALVWCGEC